MSLQLSPYIDLANRMADAAGDIMRPLFRTAITVDDKADHTPVTKADRDSEAAMRQMISKAFPNHGVIGEEYGAENPDAEFVWVLDPVDGTGAFISGVATFGTLIALCHQGRPVVGLIDQPVTRERWLGVDGQQTTYNGKPARTRACDLLSNTALFVTSRENFTRPADLAAFDTLAERTRLRRFGLDCYAFGLLSIGFGDLVCEAGLKIYDFMAVVPVVNGAGGCMTDWSGQPLTLHSGDRALASGNELLHAQALEILRPATGE